MSAADLPLGAATAPVRRVRLGYNSLVHTVFAIFVFCGCVSFIEPSPYDFMFLLIGPMWFVGGFRVPRSSAPILFLWLIYNLAGFIALMPYWGDHDAKMFEFQSLYLIFTVFFFTIFFSEKSEQRLTLCLKAYAASAIFASIIGILGYLNVAGLASHTEMDGGRLSGTFKDANVLGSYLILAAVYLVQGIVLGATRRVLLSSVGCALIFITIFLTFSRGSWGATVLAIMMLIAMSFLTAKNRRERRRIVKVSLAVMAVAVFAVLLILADPAARKMLAERAELLHSYDVGVTGRFGNQLRSIPMLLQLPNGFGPLRFRLVFGLEPHNSYINAFASYGWLGGFAWLIIVGMTMWVGFRLCFSPSPFRRLAQVFWPATFVLLLQGFQIDIDHWRQLFLCFGAIWGMEAARLKWRRPALQPTSLDKTNFP
ncbi:MAG TPA: O-antigen ligase family protein [Beijerinckiaceae bacterium]|nr:O-antigen ligase family protein [Beijerinckiaceae bacterium]HVB89042.1 O-antigen ligase family protein [Beijerinckiaceae bacterium]